MKKTIILTGLALAIATFGSFEASAASLTSKCKACHKVDKNSVGPSFKNIQAAYGNADALANTWESGFAVEDRKIAGDDTNENYGKYHKKAKMMSAQYKKLINKKVEAGEFTYAELAKEVFSK